MHNAFETAKYLIIRKLFKNRYGKHHSLSNLKLRVGITKRAKKVRAPRDQGVKRHQFDVLFQKGPGVGMIN